ncbi:hypothetical protein HC928_22430 [bacterium]|nr:hypothetical protein [bacterium]
MLEFEYSIGHYSSRDALAFAKACQLAYSIKTNDGDIESQLKNSGFSDCFILDKQLGKRDLVKVWTPKHLWLQAI